MKNLPIHPRQWHEFCELFTQLNNGTLMTVELGHLDGRRDTVVRNEMFQRMTFDTSDACNNMISFVFGSEGGRRINHEIVEPIHLRIKETAEGQKYLQIEAETGVTIVRFHSGRLPNMKFQSEFAGIAPSADDKEPIPS